MPTEYRFSISPSQAGARLDRFLASFPGTELSRSRVQALIREGFVRVNAAECKANYQLRPGDEILLLLPDPAPLQLRPQPIPLHVVYEDEDLLVVNKPAGMVVHPGAGNPENTLVNALLAHCESLSGIGGVQRPGIVHRLDKDTSGLLLAAKNDLAHQSLSAQLARRAISRRYLALAAGVFSAGSGTVNLPLGRHRLHRRKMAVDRERGRPALTRYQVLERFREAALLELELETGRTHQIRVHMACIGHPLLGDRLYGRRNKVCLRDEQGRRRETVVPRQMLHAARLSFQHPRDGRTIVCRAPLPADVRWLLEALRVDSCRLPG